MSSLLDSLKSYVTPELISKAAGMLGESNAATEKGLSAAMPAILGGLLQKSETPTGAGDILSTLSNSSVGDGLLGNLGGLFGGDSSMLSMGSGLLGNIFGDKISGITNIISSISGMRAESSSGLLSMAAPLVMGVLGKKVMGDGLGASGITSLFSKEKESILGALPAGLGGVLGMSGVNLTSGIKNTMGAATAYAKNTVEDVEERGSGMGRWFWPLLLLLLAGGLLWYFMKGCNSETSVTGALDSLTNKTAQLVDSTASLATSAVDSASTAASGAVSSAVSELGAFFKKKLPDGVELNIPDNGVENKLITFIEDKNASIDKTKWFSFDRLEFETGKSVLKPSSQEQLTNIAAIMKAYPNVNIKLGGYTDNTGNDASNMKLSADRASKTVATLVKLGIAADRLASEGYGKEHPIASNDTPEGRARNRRIDVNVTKK